MRWHSSTSPARNAAPASIAPPTASSLVASAFRRATASGSNSRSMRVLAVAGDVSVRE